MRTNKLHRDQSELRQVLGRCRGAFTAVGMFSLVVNLLMLTGPLFMLQVYDRVLSGRSEATLVALLLLVTALFAFMGILDFVRGRVLARAGARFQSLLDARVFTAVLRRSLAPSERALPTTASRDLEAVRQVLSGPAPFAVFDLPWTPAFIVLVFMFHPLLGWVAVAGTAVLITLAVLNQIRSHEPNSDALIATNEAEMLGESLRQNAEAVRGLGMREAGLERWSELRTRALQRQIVASDRTAGYVSASKAIRLYLQSLILAAGAWLVLAGEVSPGIMIAASIIIGRALAPIEQAIGQWALLQRARRGWVSLNELLAKVPEEPAKTALPQPRGAIDVQNVTALAPGEQKAMLAGISFRLEAGQALGVIGPSGAGKTTLGKLLTGVWQPVQGKVCIDGAAIDQWSDDGLGLHIGYLPQDISLFAGTVAQNIARLSSRPDDAKVIEAAKRAGAHEFLLDLPHGYDTEIGAGGQRLSGGQRPRVALARAFFGNPAFLVLDEPNASLDTQGEQSLVEAIGNAKARGTTVIVMAHRPSAISACDLLLVIDKGRQVDFGPRDEVLRRRTKNYTQIVARRTGAPGAPPEPSTPAAHARMAAVSAPMMHVVPPETTPSEALELSSAKRAKGL